MADFIGALRGMPQFKDYQPDSVTQAVQDMVIFLAGAHKWSFLLDANRTLTWVANEPVVTFQGISWISALRYPDTSTSHRPLLLKTDEDFARFKYNNEGLNDTVAWRSAGGTGTTRKIELFKVPTSAVQLKADVYTIPTTGEIDSLPGHFLRLVRLGCLSEVPNSNISVPVFDYAMREQIGRDVDMMGSVEYIPPDDHIEAGMRYINDAS